MSKQQIKYWKALVFVSCLLPLVILTWLLLTNQLGANPIESVTRESGQWALRFIIITLAVTPVRQFTGWNWLIQFRRMLGLYAFFYASVHMLLYLGLDQFFDWHEIWRDIVKRPFITIGFICFILLIPLAITSTNKMIKRLGGQRWKRLHQLIYLVAAAAGVHFLMLVKADIREPVIYLTVIGVLLLLRVLTFYKKIARVSA